jgi:hypothetical protein
MQTHSPTSSDSKAGCWTRPDWQSETYIYAIVDADTPSFELPKGLEKSKTAAVSAAGITALVGPTPGGKLRPRRRNLKAHHGVIDAVMSRVTPLPMSFGIVANSPEAVEKMLIRNADPVLDHLERVRGQVEVGLRVCFNTDDIFALMVSRHRELKDARDRNFADGREPSRQQKIELGQLFQRILDAERSEHLDSLERGLGTVSTEIIANDPRGEEEVANLAILVDRDQVDALEEAIHAVAEEFDDHFTFNYTDPLAPYTFVNVELDM